MKNIIVGFLSIVVLSGCGKDSEKEQVIENNESVLLIKGDGVDEKIIINSDYINYNFSAYDNNSYFSILFGNKDNKPIQYGSITLDQTTKAVSLDSLLMVRDGLFCPPLLACTENTIYNIESKNGINDIKINFKNSANVFFKNLNIENDTTEFTKVPVVVNGQFKTSVPQSWPIFQTQRFPIYETEGSFYFDDTKYEVSSIESPNLKYENGKLISQSIPIQLNSNIGTLNLTIIKRYDISNEYDNVFLEIKAGNFYSGKISLSNEKWIDDGNLIFLDFINVGIVDQTTGQSKNLNTNIKIPRSYAKLTLDGSKLDITPVGSSYIAKAWDDQKMYLIGSYRDNRYSELSIIQELKGHISLKYSIDGSNDITCGDRQKSCEGITFDTQRKNFSFNNVKLGVNTLNGTFYFAGILK